MRKKKHDGAHENHERWLLTYADMITLLVAFFIMLYAMSVQSKAKFEVLALSIRSGFNGNERLQSVPMSPGVGILESNALISPDNQTMVRTIGPLGIPKLGGEFESAKAAMRAEQEQATLDALQRAIEAEAKRRGLQDVIKVSQNERGLFIRILTDKLLFAKGDAHLQVQAHPILDYLALEIKKVPNDITVEGHTDNLPISTPEYPSNWELSGSRATNVLRYLTEQDKVPDDRISESGFADTRPLVPNTTEANRSRNRRVDIVVLRRYQMPADASQF